jgi:hypothetical protein
MRKLIDWICIRAQGPGLALQHQSQHFRYYYYPSEWVISQSGYDFFAKLGIRFFDLAVMLEQFHGSTLFEAR